MNKETGNKIVRILQLISIIGLVVVVILLIKAYSSNNDNNTLFTKLDVYEIEDSIKVKIDNKTSLSVIQK